MSSSEVLLLALVLDYCARRHGDGTCVATGEPCYNTWETCQDPANYSKTTKSYWFTMRKGPNLLPSGIQAWEAINNVRHVPTRIDSKSGLGVRAELTLDVADWIDGHELTDPYHSQRVTGSPSSFWAAFLERNPHYQKRPCLLYEGALDEHGRVALSDMDPLRYFLETMDLIGKMKIVAKDPMWLVDSTLPKPTSGELLENIAIDATEFKFIAGTIGEYLTDDGDGHFPAIDDPIYVRMGDEIMKVWGNQGALLENHDTLTDWTALVDAILSADFSNTEQDTNGLRIDKDTGASTAAIARKIYGTVQDWSGYAYLQLTRWIHSTDPTYVSYQIYDSSLNWVRYFLAHANYQPLAVGKDHTLFDVSAPHQSSGVMDWTAVSQIRIYVVGAAGVAMNGVTVNNLRGLSNTFTGVERSQWGTTPEAHDAEDKVQLCWFRDESWPDADRRIDAVWETGLLKSGVSSAYIDSSGACSHADRWFAEYLTKFCTSEPTSIWPLISSLLQCSNAVSWYDAVDQLVKFRGYVPRHPDDTVVEIDETGHIIEGSVKVKDREDLRINGILIYLGVYNWAEDLEEGRNYRRLITTDDETARNVNAYGDDKDMGALYCFWYPNALRFELTAIAQRVLWRRTKVPRDVEFALTSQDKGIDPIDLIKITVSKIVDKHGDPKQTSGWLLEKSRKKGDSIIYPFLAQTDVSQDNIQPSYFTDDSHPIFSAATGTDLLYGFFDDDDGAVTGSQFV